MSKRVRSAKGEIVDFDILSIKSQIAAGAAKKEEPAVEVKRSENFIDKRAKRTVAKITKKQQEPVTSE